jgi:cathepsin E
LAITEEQYAALAPLTFDLGAAGPAVLSANAQIWPRALNTAIGGDADAIYLVVADVSRPLCARGG